jgi:hypothetical protein
MSEPRFVFDTNTIVSAFLFGHSTPGRALEAARERGQLIVSDDTARELNEVLEREKFDQYVRRETRREFLTALLKEAEFIEPSEEIEVCRDPSDNKFLELAAAGKAKAIVSGDEDLLTLEAFRGVPVLTANEFAKRAGEL